MAIHILDISIPYFAYQGMQRLLEISESDLELFKLNKLCLPNEALQRALISCLFSPSLFLEIDMVF